MTFSIYHVIFGISAVAYLFFWVWGIGHAWATPQATRIQKAYWVIAMLINPNTAVWYWYTWKRWAFWMLFTPYLGAFISLPFVIRSMFKRAVETNLTETLLSFGSPSFIIFLATLAIFPLILRFVAIIHLARNTKFSAMDRNDWVVSLAMPVFGFGAGLVYCAAHRRVWALVSLGWLLVLAIAMHVLILNTITTIV